MAGSMRMARRRRGLLPKRAQRVIWRVALYLVVVAIAAWSLFPFLYMFDVSIIPTIDGISKPPRYLVPPNFDKYKMLLIGAEAMMGEVGFRTTGGFEMGAVAQQIPPALLNSLIVGLGTTIINLIIGSFAGYAMARHQDFWFTNASLNLLMVTRMLPGLALLIPFFILYRTIGLLYTRIGLIIAYSSFILPLTVWIMRGYFSTIPRSLEWSAQVDGCNWFQAFRKVFLPVAAPGLMAAGIFCFMVSWNEFLFALILVPKLEVQTVTLAIAALHYQMRLRIEDYPAMFAAGTLAALPPVVVAFVFQRYLIQGMLAGATKG